MFRTFARLGLALATLGWAAASSAAETESTLERPARRGKLPATPYAHVGWSAYTLEWGEVRLGLSGIDVGIAPRVQLGTVPLLDLAGVYNLRLKANPLRVGPLDVAVTGSAAWLPMGGFQGRELGAGTLVSVRVARPFSLHLGAGWMRLDGAGIPSRLPPLIDAVTDVDLEAFAAQARAVLGDDPNRPSLFAEGVWVRAAADVRITRRDTLVLQGAFAPWVHAGAEVAFNEDFLQGLLGDVALGAEKTLGVREVWSASLSWQITLRNLDLRLGGGASSVPLAWIAQANDIAIRAGGRTRREEAQAWKAWRASRRTERSGELGLREVEVEGVVDLAAVVDVGPEAGARVPDLGTEGEGAELSLILDDDVVVDVQRAATRE